MQEVRKVLWMWRRQHGARQGQQWDPYVGRYMWPHQARQSAAAALPDLLSQPPADRRTVFAVMMDNDSHAWD